MKGEMSLEGCTQPFTVYKHYCFNTLKWPVEVYFVDDPTKKHLDSLTPSLNEHTSFFHSLPFNGDSACATSFSHLCDKDMYEGEFVVYGKNAFDWNWSVAGPNKDGKIDARFSRCQEP